MEFKRPAINAEPLDSQQPTLNLRVKMRLDQLLVARGLCESREKAQRAIMAGDVTVAGHVVDKQGTKIADDAEVQVKTADRYVGRGGHKLEAALRQSLRIAQAANGWHGDAQADAAVLIAYVLGRWQLFAKSGFRRTPQDGWALQRKFLFG